MIVLRILAYALGAFGIVGTLLPFLRYDDYWIRGFDYPRPQLVFILLASSVLFSVSRPNWHTFDFIMAVLLIGSLVYQAARMLPYTSVYRVQSRRSEAEVSDQTSISLMVSNVLQPNEEYQKVIDLVRRYDPDLLLTLESDETWGTELHNALDDDYPYHVDVPLDNLYGMHLFSKKELHNPTVKYRIKDDIPSIEAFVKLGNGREVDLYLLHPMPPSPSEAYASTGRDAELAQVGLEVAESDRTTIVAGDMNDVAWSHSSRLFQRLSGLLDPRRGRGLYATFHADYRLARWPLDHVFHSTDLALVQLERLPHVGSDHFPVFIQLNYEPSVSAGRQKSDDADDREEAERVIKHGEKQEDDVLIPQ